MDDLRSKLSLNAPHYDDVIDRTRKTKQRIIYFIYLFIYLISILSFLTSFFLSRAELRSAHASMVQSAVVLHSNCE